MKAEIAARNDDPVGAEKLSFLVSKSSIDADEPEQQPIIAIGWHLKESVAINFHFNFFEGEGRKHSRRLMVRCDARLPAVHRIPLETCSLAAVL